jgi:hypothetical protein
MDTSCKFTQHHTNRHNPQRDSSHNQSVAGLVMLCLNCLGHHGGIPCTREDTYVRCNWQRDGSSRDPGLAPRSGPSAPHLCPPIPLAFVLFPSKETRLAGQTLTGVVWNQSWPLTQPLQPCWLLLPRRALFLAKLPRAEKIHGRSLAWGILPTTDTKTFHAGSSVLK